MHRTRTVKALTQQPSSYLHWQEEMNESADQRGTNGACRSSSPKTYKPKKVSDLSGKLLKLIKSFSGSQWKDFEFDSVISQTFFVPVIILDLDLVIIPSSHITFFII